MNSRPEQTLSATEEFERLDALGILPPAASIAIYSAGESPAQGLLGLWQEWLRLAPKSRRSRAARIHSGLLAAVENGAELTFAIPGRDRLVCVCWLGQRAYWLPRGVMNGQRVGIVSSRLKRAPALQASILQALRLSMTAVEGSSQQIVASAGTSLYDYVEQCATTFGVPLLRVSTPIDPGSSKNWLEEIVRTSGSSSEFELLVSPDASSLGIDASPDSGSTLTALQQLPIRDRVLALMSDRLFVLTLRRNGNWWKLLQFGFANGLWDAGTVRAIMGQGLCTEEVGRELQNLGAVAWYLAADDDLIIRQHSCRQEAAEHSHVPLAKSDRKVAEDALVADLVRTGSTPEWLIHWTRAPQKEWAGESCDEHFSSMLLSDACDERTAFGTLQRIVNEKALRATSGNTRANVDVVCFSELPLVMLLPKRVFRSHRGRWDFEHFGIGVRKQRIKSLGGRPVIYGDESVWQNLPEGERPWFQPQQSQTGDSPIDWTVESEWRLTSTLYLGNLPEDDVFLFCKTEHEATELRTACDWRVVSVEALECRSRELRATSEANE